MKNIKIKQKLVISFIVLAIITAIVSVVGIAGLGTLSSNQDSMYIVSNNVRNANRLIDNIGDQRVTYRDMLLFKSDKQSAAISKLNTLDEEYAEIYNYLNTHLLTEEAQVYLKEINSTYNNEYRPLRLELAEAALRNDQARVDEVVALMAKPIGAMVTNTNDLIDFANQYIADISARDTKIADSLIIMMIALGVFSFIGAVLWGLFITKQITAPLFKMKAIMDRVGNTGSLVFSEREMSELEKEAASRDEIGQSIASALKMILHFEKASKTLGQVASGDLTAKFDSLSEMDTIGVSLNHMLSNLNEMFGEIQQASTQVSLGASQMALGAQEVAIGSTKQSASIERFTDMLSELKRKTEQNAINAAEAQDKNLQSANMLKSSIQSMSEMLVAMKAIDESSASITRVIKVIDEIAFQTNILALNAAVEAARAGQYGKGFAVVADEVRNLAAKSSEAAKETTQLIEGSTERVMEGNAIVAKTNSDLDAVGQFAQEITRLINQVSDDSSGQAGAIAQISNNIAQISNVIQANSAASEESASASEEISAQSAALEEIVAKFKLRKNNSQSVTFEKEPAQKCLKEPKGITGKDHGREKMKRLPHEPTYEVPARY